MARLRVWVVAGVSALLLSAAWVAASGPRASYALYAIQSGDSLGKVAKQFKLDPETIASLNGLRSPHVLREDHGLLLPDGPTTQSLPRYTAWTKASKRERCAAVPWSSARTTSQRECTSAYCSDGPRGQKVCLCSETSTPLLVVSPPHASRLPLTAAGYPTPWCRAKDCDMQVVDVDLDGDGAPETVISILGVVSNGVGQAYRDLVVLRQGTEILRFDSGDFSAKDALVRRDGGCHLASKHLETVRHPLRGSALYSVERSLDPKTGRVDPEIVGTRVSDSERFYIPFDPLLAVPPAAAVSGTLIRAQFSEPDQRLTAVEVGTKAGAKRFAFSQNDAVRFVDSSSKRAYPLGYVPPLAGRISVSTAQGGGAYALSTW